MGASAPWVRTCTCLPEDRKPARQGSQLAALQGSTREKGKKGKKDRQHPGACTWGGTTGLCCGWPQPAPGACFGSKPAAPPASKQAAANTKATTASAAQEEFHHHHALLLCTPSLLPSAGPHHNLWTNLDVGKGTRPFASSGNASRGAHAARLNTWWNIYSSLASAPALKLPECGYGVLENFFGAFGAPPGAAPAGQNVRYPGWCGGAPLSWVVELPSNGAKQFSPADLHSAMLATRSQRLAAVKQG